MNKEVKKEFKVSTKRGLIEILCEFPILLLCTIGFYLLKLPNWLSILLTVCVGVLVYIIIEIIAYKLSSRKKKIESEKPKKFDPYAD